MVGKVYDIGQNARMVLWIQMGRASFLSTFQLLMQVCFQNFAKLVECGKRRHPTVRKGMLIMADFLLAYMVPKCGVKF